jgi:hypothetical protein
LACKNASASVRNLAFSSGFKHAINGVPAITAAHTASEMSAGRLNQRCQIFRIEVIAGIFAWPAVMK